MSATKVLHYLAMSRGETDSTVPAPLGSGTRSLLPPCRVCGGKASGLHYCVNTCQACRMFYRRIIKKTEKPECLRSGNCPVDHLSLRNACTACRYKKCVAEGMKVTDKRVGRYSHAMRTTYTQEVQALQLNVQVSSHSQSLLSTSERDQQLDHMITHLADRYYRQNHNKMDVIAMLPDVEEQLMEEKMLREQLFGSLRSVSDAEYEQIYNATGLDVDGRRQFFQHIFPKIERNSRDYISFAKSIPGFERLSVKDKVSIFRESIVKADIMNGYYLYNPDLQIWTFPHETLNCMDHMHDQHDQHGVWLLKKAMWALQQLQLTPQEAAVVFAYLITNVNPDCSPEGRRILSHICDTVSELLWRVICQNQDHPQAFLATLTSVMLTIEEVSYILTKEFVDNFYKYSDMNWPFCARVVLDTDKMEALHELWNDVLNFV